MSRTQRTNALLLAGASLSLLLLPLVSTLNSLFADLVIRVGFFAPLLAVAGFESQVVASLLSHIGIESASSAQYLVVKDRWGMNQILYISWNCVGWQSILFLSLTLISGLRGISGKVFRFQIICIGILGTFLVNILRIFIVGVLAALVGRIPAIMVHDYGGTFLTLFWFLLFWFVIQASLAEDDTVVLNAGPLI